MCDEVLMSVYTFHFNELETDYSIKQLSSSQFLDRSTRTWGAYGSQAPENELVISFHGSLSYRRNAQLITFPLWLL